jgi:hypothetical protein
MPDSNTYGAELRRAPAALGTHVVPTNRVAVIHAVSTQPIVMRAGFPNPFALPAPVGGAE